MGVALTIIIVNWNSKDYLRGCLKALRDISPDEPREIIVVDGGSFDGCAEMLSIEFPEVVFIQSKDNIGFGRANNLGFTRATGECLLLLNPDTVLNAEALRSMMDSLRSLPEAGIIGPRLITGDGTLQLSSVRKLPTIWNRALESDLLRRAFPNSDLWGTGNAYSATRPVEVEAVSGACMLMRADTFRKVGGFSSDYFMYAEDMDLCKQVRDLGLRNYHEPRAAVLHYGGRSSKSQISKFESIMILEAGTVYMRRNHSRRAALVYRLAQSIPALVRLAALVPLALFNIFSSGSKYRSLVSKWLAVLKWSFGGERWAADLCAKQRSHGVAPLNPSSNFRGVTQKFGA